MITYSNKNHQTFLVGTFWFARIFMLHFLKPFLINFQASWFFSLLKSTQEHRVFLFLLFNFLIIHFIIQFWGCWTFCYIFKHFRAWGLFDPLNMKLVFIPINIYDTLEMLQKWSMWCLEVLILCWKHFPPQNLMIKGLNKKSEHKYSNQIKCVAHSFTDHSQVVLIKYSL